VHPQKTIMESPPAVRPRVRRNIWVLLASPSLKLLSLIVLFVSGQAFAQDSHSLRHKGTLDLSIWTAAETGEEKTNSFKESQILLAGAFVGWTITGEHGSGWWRGSLEYAFDVMPVFETWGNQHIRGGGFDPMILRWNSALHTTRISPYIELSGGGVITTANLPPGNTSSFNFTPKGGGGIYLRTRKRQAFDMGFRWSHISNANLGIQNPEFNGVQLSLAYHWFK
jgi:hypothetical protein